MRTIIIAFTQPGLQLAKKAAQNTEGTTGRAVLTAQIERTVQTAHFIPFIRSAK